MRRGRSRLTIPGAHDPELQPKLRDEGKVLKRAEGHEDKEGQRKLLDKGESNLEAMKVEWEAMECPGDRVRHGLRVIMCGRASELLPAI